MTIRKATYQETEEIFNCSLNVFKESTMGLIDVKETQEVPLISSFLEDGGYYLVYSENNVIKGWIGIANTCSYYGGKWVGVITEVYVLPEYRRKGIARQLCVEGINKLQEQGIHKVQLQVFTGNFAKQLYQNLGFKVVSTLMEKEI
ncbi:N-acetyltransferase family protein [Niallia sp. Krafla_26]|uniref:GNAT family N-acetyltransferase n=1 Tax=Niallia sp. Krafla_26 TaxID=3064703 RepID=UPI003D163492